MNIGLAIYGDLKDISGGYLYDKKLVDHMKHSGHQVEVISLPEEMNRLQNIKHNFSDDIVKKIVNLNLDILLEDELCFLSLFHLNERLPTDLKIISIVHHLSYIAERDEQKQKLYRYFESKYLETVDEFICNSAPTERSIRDTIGEITGIVANPGKDHFKAPETIKKDFSEGGLEAVFVGNLTPHKCLDVIFHALDKTEDIEVNVVGDMKWNETYTEKIKDLIKEKGLEKRVNLLGRVSDSGLTEILEKSDVLLLPSTYEGFGLTIVEALAYKTPVIATDRGGPSKIIEDGKEGFLVSPLDAEKLRSRLTELKGDPEKLESMGENARERYKELPSWEQCMGKIEKYLESIADL